MRKVSTDKRYFEFRCTLELIMELICHELYTFQYVYSSTQMSFPIALYLLFWRQHNIPASETAIIARYAIEEVANVGAASHSGHRGLIYSFFQ